MTLHGEANLMKNVLDIDAEIVERNVYRGKSPCMVHVRIKNVSSTPVLVNKCLEMGYRDSFDRTLFVEVFKKGTNEVVSVPAEDYQRTPALPQDYEYLEPEGNIIGSFDLCEWYSFPLSLEGDFEMVVYYQADEPRSGEKPEGIVKGVYASKRIPFKIIE